MVNKKDTSGELNDAPNEAWSKFLDKFKDIDSVNIKDWKAQHLLAYFCKKYYETYNVKYSFKFNSPFPMKSFEIFQIKKLASLLTSKPELLKEYIDWVYATKVVKAKRRLTSISFMTVEGVVNEYKINILLAGKNIVPVNRTTDLPTNFASILSNIGLPIKTYGDLAFASQMNDPSPEILLAFSKLEEAGFDKTILTKIV
jgi:hypothetical protein